LDYVYGYYNHIRPHSSNGYMTPFEKRYSNQ
jgi:putative transposase